ncbi:MAG TPA: class II aldolase/adducin family protein [Candidatus Nitrosotenuis sp.]|nr:class II aldolase/adducin family protein [Candidatus Nitrosotenuis sp.]
MIPEEEWIARQTLAQCYHLAAKFGWTDLIYTHISARVPNQEGVLLINPFGLLYEQITPDNLLKVNFAGQIIDGPANAKINLAGYVIHSAIHEARHDVACIMHTHTPAGIAISALDCGLLPMSQHACRFYNRIAYHTYNGITFDTEEQPRLIKDLGHHMAMILHNHGFLTVGRTIPEAFVLMHYLERAAEAQLKAMSTGQKIIIPPPDVCEKAARQFGDDETIAGTLEWPALVQSLIQSQ